jgi:hypothetical protein
VEAATEARGAFRASGHGNEREGCEGPRKNPQSAFPLASSIPSFATINSRSEVSTAHSEHFPRRDATETRSGIDERHDAVDEVGGDLLFLPATPRRMVGPREPRWSRATS